MPSLIVTLMSDKINLKKCIIIEYYSTVTSKNTDQHTTHSFGKLKNDRNVVKGSANTLSFTQFQLIQTDLQASILLRQIVWW